MITDPHSEGQAGASRFFAVVAAEQSRVDEVVACFAQAGDHVETQWYASGDELLAKRASRAFDAVIFYAAPADQAAERTEEQLRAALTGTAFSRVAAWGP